MEKDDEVNGSTGSSYDFGARQYDSRLGRWLSRDPQAVKYPSASPYIFALNTPVQATDPNGKTVYFTNKKEANTVVTDLNVIYEKKYGFEGAFKVVAEKMVLKKVNEKYQSWNPFSDEPKYVNVTVVVYKVKTNEEFDWNTDKYTKAEFDILNTRKRIKADIVPSKSTPLSHPYSGTPISKIKGHADKSGNVIKISNGLNTAEEGGWSYGGTFLHESIGHFHYLGGKEKAHPLQDHYKLPNSSINHEGKPKMEWKQTEKTRLKKLRDKTGKTKTKTKTK
jgi:RHS repeat-associated protein